MQQSSHLFREMPDGLRRTDATQMPRKVGVAGHPDSAESVWVKPKISNSLPNGTRTF